ncbi:MAG: peptidoglycan-binding protein, partial [Burkholderiales bacterium]
MTALRTACACFLLLLWLPGAAHADAFQDALAGELLTGHAASGGDETTSDLATAASFYAQRDNAPLWVTGGAANERALLLAEILLRADEEGLDPADYGAEAIRALLPADRADLLARLELRLTLGVMAYASDLASGRLEPAKVDPEVFVYPLDVDRAEVLQVASALDATGLRAYLRGLAPQQNEYRRLRQALADYRALAAAGGWPGVAGGETLKPGMRGPRVLELRRRLAASGELPPTDFAQALDASLYDESLERAVRLFQDRHGLDIDGAVGKQTLAALNATVERRIEQMLLNMERRRWMPDDYGWRYLFVNIADFEVKLVHGPRTLYDGRVVVGVPYRRT